MADLSYNGVMKKLLLISAIAPFPQTSGGAMRIYETIKHLSTKYELTVLMFGDQINDQEEKAFLDKSCEAWQVFPLRERFLTPRLPYYFSCWENINLILELHKLLATKTFAQVRVEFTQIAYLAEYLPENVEKVFVAHDISTISFQRRMQQQTNLAKKSFALFNLLQIKAFEKKWLKQYDKVVAVSAHDQKELLRRFRLKNVTVEQNGLEAIRFLEKLPNDHQVSIGYIGAFSHPPNKIAVKHIINKIIPKLEKKQLDYELILAGENDLKNDNQRIKNLGRVKKIEDFYARIQILVAPIMAGSGTRIKILEALSFGIPVVTTEIGAEGIDIDSSYLQIVRDDDEWLEAIGRAKNELREEDKKKLKEQLQGFLWSESFRES